MDRPPNNGIGLIVQSRSVVISKSYIPGRSMTVCQEVMVGFENG